MSPRHLKELSESMTQTTLRYPIELKKKIIVLIMAGRIKHFNSFIVDAVEHQVKLELRNLKYKGKRHGNGTGKE